MTAHTRRRLVTWVTRVLLIAVLALLAFAVAVLIVIPRATHGVAMSVLTGSMTPKIPVGSIVIDRPVDPGTLHVGDIATYQKAAGKAEYITHRIVKIDTTKSPVMFTFKGDANRGPDIAPVPATAIRGKVWFHVRYLGAIRDALHTRGGLAGLGMLGLAGYAVAMIVSARKERGSMGHESGAGPTSQTESDEQAPSPPGPRIMILATLRTREFEGLTPPAVSRLLGGVLLDSKRHAFTVLVVEDFGRAIDTFALLQSFEPVSLQTALAEPTDLGIERLELDAVRAELNGADV